MRFFATSALLIVVFTGCSAPQPAPEPIGVVAIPGVDAGGKVRHSLDDPEVAALWTGAEIARDEKQYAEAAVQIEKALRIIPDDPVLWSRLAELRMQLEDNVLAENYAAKSNLLAAENRVLQYRNWLIIQHARDRRDDILGAREAQIEVRKYAPSSE